MKTLFAAIAIAFFATPALATPRTTGTIEVQAGRSLYINWKHAAPGRPTLVLLNGLTYTTQAWDAFEKQLVARGYGVFRYDPTGMGKTLEMTGAVQKIIRIEDQARDLDLLTKAVGLTGKLDLVGLSYGGGLAIAFAGRYGDRIHSAFMMAPFTEPLAQQDQQIRAQIAWTRLTFPLNPASDAELYAYFLRQNVYYIYPLTEPSMNDSPLKPEAVFQMTQGIRTFDMFAAARHFPPHTANLMLAGKDQYIPREYHERFWANLPAEVRGQRVVIENSEHKIPEAAPEAAAQWIDQVLQATP